MPKTKEPTEKEIVKIAGTSSFLFFYRGEIDALRTALEHLDTGDNVALRSGIERIVRAARLGDSPDLDPPPAAGVDEGEQPDPTPVVAEPVKKKRGRPKKTG